MLENKPKQAIELTIWMEAQNQTEEALFINNG